MKRKTVIVTISALVLVVLTASVLVAGPFGHGGFDNGHGRFMLEMLDCKIQSLDLSDEQQEQYQAIRARMEADMTEAQAMHDKIRQQIRAEMESNDPDLHAIAATVKTKLDQVPEKFGNHIDSVLEIYDMLDPDQQAQVLDMIRDKMRRHCDG